MILQLSGKNVNPHAAVQVSQRLSQRPEPMPAPRQGNLFKDSTASRECAECGEIFVPEEPYHEYCSDCFDRKQKRRKKPEESSTEWVERFYGHGA